MTKHDFVEYVKNHKKEIALGALGVIGSGVLIALGVKGLNSCKGSGNPVEMIGDIIDNNWSGNPVEMIGNIIDDNWRDKNVVDGFTTGKVNDVWNEGSYGNAIVQYFKIKDMGDLGEDLKKIKGITDDTEVSAVLSFVDTIVEI